MAESVPAQAGDSDDDIIERARERYAYSETVDSKNRKAQEDNTRFVYVPGEQWPVETRRLREKRKDPCLEFPQLKQFVNQVVNDQRQNRPGIRIHPASGDASDDVAEILQGLIRGIEYDSRAEAVYDSGYQHSVVGGRGYWRIVSEYENAQSFNQRLVIKRIPDPLSVRLDPDYQEPDGSDRKWGFVSEPMPRAEFQRQYPKAKALSWSDDSALWYPDKDHVVVADYYERQPYPRTLVRMSDGAIGWKDKLPKVLPEGIEVVEERESEDYTVKWYRIAGGDAILERFDWPGTIIPVVCTMGDEIIVSGERVYQGLIEQAKGTQMLFNFGMTQQAVHLALTPRAPYIAAVGQIEGLEPIWDSANDTNLSVLPYKPTTVDGIIVPPPQRQQGSSPDAGWINWTQQMQMLLKSTIGMYENSLGMRGQESSGRAIIARERQGDNATFHYVDNLSRAIALTGRILVECIPTYYDTERIVQIVGQDDVRKMVKVNEQVPGAFEAIRNNDITVGDYAVTVQAGPSYATKRQETAELISEMVKAFPPLMQAAGDLVMKAQDVPDADVFAKRMRHLLLPAVQQEIAQDERAEGGAPPIPPEVQQQLMQMQQALQQAQQQMQALIQENAALKDDNQVTILKAAMDNATKILLDLNQPPPAGVMPADPMADPMMGGPAPVITVAPPRPSPQDMMAELPALMAQIVQMGQQLAAAVSAPRQVALQTDPMGNPVGAVSTVIQ